MLQQLTFSRVILTKAPSTYAKFHIIFDTQIMTSFSKLYCS